VIFAHRTLRTEQRGVSVLLVMATLLFAQTCAVHGGVACAAPAEAPGAKHAVAAADDDGCDDHDGNGGGHDGCDDTRGPCSGSTICCSTWAPAPATLSVAPPPAVPLALLSGNPSLGLSAALVAAPAPIPSESPPPLISILRL